MEKLNLIKKNYLLLSILLIAAFLRFYHIDFQSIWLDEIHTMIEGNPKMPYKEFYDIMISREQMPHLYFMLVKIFSFVFGHTTFVVRCLSALIGVVSVYGIYLLGKEIYNKKVGLIAATLLTVNYFHIGYSQEIRPYILLSLFATFSFYRLIIFLKNHSYKNAILYGLFSSLMINTHFFGLFILVSQFFIISYFLFDLPKEERKKYMLSSVLAGVVTIFLWLPSINIFLVVSKIKSFWIQLPTPEVYFGVFKDFFGSAENILFITYLLGVYYFIRMFNEKKEKDTPTRQNKELLSFIVLLNWIFITLLIPYIRTFLDVPMIISRYFIGILPAIILILAIAIANIKSNVVQRLIIIIFIVASITDIIAVKDYYNKISKTQYREITEKIIEKNKTNAIIVSSWGWHLRYFFTNEKVKMETKDQTLQEFVDDMKTKVTPKRAFWFVGAHFQTYTLNTDSEAFLNSNFNQIESLEFHDTWARYYVPKAGVGETFVLSINEFEPIKSDNEINLLLFSNSTTKSKPVLLEPGDYRVAIKAKSLPDPPIAGENANIAITADGKDSGATFVTEKEEKIYYFNFTVKAKKEVIIGITFGNDLVLNDQDRNVLIYSVIVEKVTQ